MASTKATATSLFYFFFLSSAILLGDFFPSGFAAEEAVPLPQWNSNSPTEMHVKIDRERGFWRLGERNSRRLMIGSTAPTCTYNECRGCKFKCRAEQIPVDGNDPINSAYHYRCVCHR